MLHGDSSGVAPEHTKVLSFLLFCNAQILCGDGILTDSRIALKSGKLTMILKTERKKNPNNNNNNKTYQRIKLFHDRNCPVNWQFDLETIEKRHQREYDATA